MKKLSNRGCAVAKGVIAVTLGLSYALATAESVPPAAPATQIENRDAKAEQSITTVRHPVPKFDYTDAGKAIMVKRYPFFPTQNPCQFTKYRYYENKRGVESYDRCGNLLSVPGCVLSEQQKAVVREWGQPAYLRGPFKTTQGDVTIEWAYHSTNHLFQFVDGTMVYEGPLTDQERTAITYGAPKEAIVSILEPNVRRETWIYRPTFLWGREHLVSFTNGKLTYEQSTE